MSRSKNVKLRRLLARLNSAEYYMCAGGIHGFKAASIELYPSEVNALKESIRRVLVSESRAGRSKAQSTVLYVEAPTTQP